MSNPSKSFSSLSLRENFSWTLVGNIVFALAQWLMIVLLAKRGSAAAVGQYALALAVVTPIQAFTNLQLRIQQSTDASHRFKFSDYLATRLLTSALAMVIVALVSVFSGFSLTMVILSLVVALVKSIDSISDVYYGALQQSERMDYIAISMIFHGVLHFGVFSVIYLNTHELALSVAGMSLVSILLLLIYDIPRSSNYIRPNDEQIGQTSETGTWVPRFVASNFKTIAWLGLPLSIVVTLNSLSGNVPRYFIADRLGDEQLGIFAAMFYLTIAGSTVMGAVGNSASPRLAKLFAEGYFSQFLRLVGRLVVIAIATSATGFMIALIAGQELLAFIYKPEYAIHQNTFLWLMAATFPMFVGSVFGVSVNAMRRFHAQAPLPFVNLIFAIVLAAYLISDKELVGGGQVIFFSAMFSMISILLLFSYFFARTKRTFKTQ